MHSHPFCIGVSPSHLGSVGHNVGFHGTPGRLVSRNAVYARCPVEGMTCNPLQTGEASCLQIPLEIAIRETSDSGAPIAASSPQSASALAYHKIATRLKEKLFDPAAGRQAPTFSAE